MHNFGSKNIQTYRLHRVSIGDCIHLFSGLDHRCTRQDSRNLRNCLLGKFRLGFASASDTKSDLGGWGRMVSSTTRSTVIKTYLEISIQARRLENEIGIVRQWGPVPEHNHTHDRTCISTPLPALQTDSDIVTQHQ